MEPANSDAGTSAAAAVAQWRALAPALAARGRMRLSYDGGRNYPRRYERALSPDPPPCPAAVHVYAGDGTTRLLVADFDTKRAAGRGAADPAAQVAADAAAFAALVAACGGRGFGDISPNGGRHGYVLWAAAVPFEEMRRVALALARRLPSLDPSPMLGRDHGVIRPPGSRHRSGGFQVLTTPLNGALRCAAAPNGPQVWQRLCAALSSDLDAIERGEAPLPPGYETAPEASQRRQDGAGMPWLPRPGGRVPQLRPDMELTAVTGQFDTSRRTRDGKPWTPSEARFAVLCSAAARGWQLADITERLRSGVWDGLAGFYGRYRPGRQRAGRLAADWKKAVAIAARQKSGRNSDTRGTHHTGGNLPHCGDLARVPAVDDYREIRRWDSALRAAERQRWPGRRGLTVRLVMRALAAAAQMTGSVVIEFGTRSIGMLAGVDHSTAARVLRDLREEPDPFIVLLDTRRGVRGDLYMLRIPDEHGEAARWRRWRPGRIGVHPVFRALGGAAALICEQLTSEPIRTADLPVMTGLSATAVNTALAGLAAHGIAVRGCGGWRRGPADLDEIAVHLGIPEQLAELHAQHVKERQIWRARLMHVQPPAVSPALPSLDDVPWPDEPPAGDRWRDSEPDAARAPPDDAAVLGALKAELGPISLVGTA